jgi:hypothetical protein
MPPGTLHYLFIQDKISQKLLNGADVYRRIHLVSRALGFAKMGKPFR